MRCPKCRKEGCRYVTQRNKNISKKMSIRQRQREHKATSTRNIKLPPRRDFRAFCRNCDFNGDIR